jgi:hypothetical protein
MAIPLLLAIAASAYQAIIQHSWLAIVIFAACCLVMIAVTRALVTTFDSIARRAAMDILHRNNQMGSHDIRIKIAKSDEIIAFVDALMDEMEESKKRKMDGKK